MRGVVSTIRGGTVPWRFERIEDRLRVERLGAGGLEGLGGAGDEHLTTLSAP